MTRVRSVRRTERDRQVLAVLLFGSQARGDATPRSDVDVCLALTPASDSRENAAATQLAYLSAFDLDIVVFQHVPLYLRSRILREARVLFVRDEEALYALAISTVRAWEDFRHIHRCHLEEVARGRIDDALVFARDASDRATVSNPMTSGDNGDKPHK